MIKHSTLKNSHTHQIRSSLQTRFSHQIFVCHFGRQFFSDPSQVVEERAPPPTAPPFPNLFAQTVKGNRNGSFHYFWTDADECECDVHGQSCGVDVGSPRPPSSPSPDFIGSETSSPSHSSQNPEILLSLCGGLHGNKVRGEVFVVGFGL